MTDRLQQKAEEIVREVCGTASAKYWQDQSVAHKCALAGLTAGIAMAAEREIIAKALHESGQCHYDRGTWEQLKASGKECTCYETADIIARALAKGETQHG